MKKWLLITLVLVLAMWILASVIHLALDMRHNEQARTVIHQALSEQFPSAVIHSDWGYDRPGVYLTIEGVADGQDRERMREWLVKLKADQRLTVTIRLKFDGSPGVWEGDEGFTF